MPQLLALGYSVAQLCGYKRESYSVYPGHIFPASELLAGGVTLAALREANMLSKFLREAGYMLSRLRAAGWKATPCRA